MGELYPAVDPRLRAAADGNVRAHLTQLRQEGSVHATPGRKRRPSPERRARQQAQARERGKVIRQARRYEHAARRDALRRQEQPPNDEWAKPPTYEIPDR